jgi:hypothetical protein
MARRRSGIAVASRSLNSKETTMTDRRDDRRIDSSPYGPQPERVDEAAGGADSSPFENQPSGEKAPAAEEDRKERRKRDERPRS